jgi:predicted nucleotidyltransferase
MGWTTEQTHHVARRRLRKERERARELEERRSRAIAHARALALEIGEQDTTVRKIWGFGSVFDERLPFRPASDIDLAAEGGTILAWKLSQKSSWNVDWVELEEQPESFAEAIRARGTLLYERQ